MAARACATPSGVRASMAAVTSAAVAVPMEMPRGAEILDEEAPVARQHREADADRVGDRPGREHLAVGVERQREQVARGQPRRVRLDVHLAVLLGRDDARVGGQLVAVRERPAPRAERRRGPPRGTRRRIRARASPPGARRARPIRSVHGVNPSSLVGARPVDALERARPHAAEVPVRQDDVLDVRREFVPLQHPRPSPLAVMDHRRRALRPERVHRVEEVRLLRVGCEVVRGPDHGDAAVCEKVRDALVLGEVVEREPFRPVQVQQRRSRRVRHADRRRRRRETRSARCEHRSGRRARGRSGGCMPSTRFAAWASPAPRRAAPGAARRRAGARG